MPFRREICFRALLVVYIMSLAAYLLHGMSLEYKMISSNCDLKDAEMSILTASLGACAALCTQSSSYKRFAMRNEECGLLEIIPASCPLVRVDNSGWNFYSPDSEGKMQTLF